MVSDLFGGGDSGGGGGGSVNAYNQLPANIKGILDRYMSGAENAANTPYQQYQGDRINPLTELEQQARGYAQDNFGSAAPVVNNANQVLSEILGDARGGPTLDKIQPYMSSYQQGVINNTKNEAIRDFETTTLPMVGRNAAMSGAFGGSRQGVLESEAYRNLNQNLTDIQTRGDQENYLNAQDVWFKTLQNTGATALDSAKTALLGQNAIQSDVNMLTGLGQTDRALGQAQMDINYQDWANQVQHPINSINLLGGMLSNVSPYFASVPQTNQTGSGSGGNFLNTVGNVAGTVGSIASIFSDERVKDNIKEVGQLDNGLPVYSYNYKGSPKTQIGVMAQDVEQSNPDAVSEMGGIKMVDYNKATENGDGAKGYFGGGLVDSISGLFKGERPVSVTWDDGGVTQGTRDWSLMDTIGNILSGKDEDGNDQDFTQLSKLLGDHADRRDKEVEANANRRSKLGDYMANVRFQELLNPYKNQGQNADALALQSMGNLFGKRGFAEGGLVGMNPTPTKENPLTVLLDTQFKSGGKVEEDFHNFFKDLDASVRSTPAKIADWLQTNNREGKEEVARRGEVFNEQNSDIAEAVKALGGQAKTDLAYMEDLLNPKLDKRIGEPVLNFMKNVWSGGKDKPVVDIPEDYIAKTLAQIEPGTPSEGTPSETKASAVVNALGLAQPNQGSSSSNSAERVKQTLKEFGLDKILDAPTKKMPKQNPWMTFGLGSMLTGDGYRSASAGLGAQSDNAKGEYEADSKQRQEKLGNFIKALEAAAAVEKINNSQDYLKLAYAQMAAKAAGIGKTGKTPKTLEEEIAKAYWVNAAKKAGEDALGETDGSSLRQILESAKKQ